MPGDDALQLWNGKDNTMINIMLRYLKDTSAATALAFALIFPVVIGAAGFSVDVANAYMVKQRLSHAVDAAALAAAASATSTNDINATVQEFFALNYPPDKIGADYNVQVEIQGSDIKVSATAKYTTYFARVLALNEFDVYEDSTVTREIIGLEVAMVLDVTGSMNTNNNIATLRTAATNFTNILFNNAAFPDSVKIGLVPFATAVNVGPYGLGQTPSGGFYDTAFVRNPNNLRFNQSQTNQWHGCVLAQPTPRDTENSSSDWRWDMYRYTNSGARNANIRNQSVAPNTGCNRSYILPLTSNRTTIISRINGLRADGNTLSNLGMVWGYRVLSPEFPFREGVAWNNQDWRKVALLMTDGDNFINDVYSAYGPWNILRMTDEMLNVRLAQTCENMKEDGITIYTITFTSNIDNRTKDYFRQCASDTDKYIDAPTQADLIAAFEQISRELSNIHISE
jgi:Flp pilus assembly protein TadG